MLLLLDYITGWRCWFGIESFGTFVVGGNYVVGTVIFLILVIINFVVITRCWTNCQSRQGLHRCNAGKQMSIDAEMNSALSRSRSSKRERIQKMLIFTVRWTEQVNLLRTYSCRNF